MGRRRYLFFWFYLAKILANLAVFAFLPLLPLFLTAQNTGIFQVGAFFSALAIARFAFGLLGGWLADHLGHLRSLAIGSFIGLGAFALFVLNAGWGLALAGMVLIYAASALTTPSQSAFIGSTAGERRGKAFGFMNAIHTAAQMGGPALGGWLVETAGFPALFRTAGALYFTAALIRIFLSRRGSAGKPGEYAGITGFSEDLRRMTGLIAAGSLLAWMLLADGLGDIAMSLTETYQPLFLDHAGLAVMQIGMISSLAYGATLISHPIAGWMVDRYGERVPAFLSFALTGVGILVFTFATDFLTFMLAWALVGLMWGLGSTAFDALISRAVPEQHRGLAYGLFSTAQGFFSLPVPLLGGWLYGVSAPAPFLAAALVSLLGAALAFQRFPDRERGNLPARHGAAGPHSPQVSQQL